MRLHKFGDGTAYPDSRLNQHFLSPTGHRFFRRCYFLTLKVLSYHLLENFFQLQGKRLRWFLLDNDMDSIVVLPSKLEREVEGVVNPTDVQQHLIVFSDSPQLLEFLQIAVLDRDGFLVVCQPESPEVEAGDRFVQR